MDDQIKCINRGQIASQDIPGFAAVFGDIHAYIRSHIQDVPVEWIFSDDIHRSKRYIAGDVFPGFAKIRGFPDMEKFRGFSDRTITGRLAEAVTPLAGAALLVELYRKQG